MTGSAARSAIVVGAGLSGLAAAWRLERAGVATTVLEAGTGPGGRAQTEQVGGYLVDTGPDAATSGYERWLALVADLGLTDQLTEPSPVLGILGPDGIIEIDRAAPLQALRAPWLTPGAKARLAAGVARLLPRLRHVDPYEMHRSVELDDPGTTARAFAERRFGREVTDRLIDPVIRLVTGSGAAEASTLSLYGALSAWSSPIINLRGGLASVPRGVAARLADVRYGSEVTAVAACGTGVEVCVNGTDMLSADGCVIAAMYDQAAAMWPELSALAPEFAPALRHVKLISVSLGYDLRPASRAYAVLVPTVEEPDALLIFLQHNKAPDRAPAGRGLITIYTDTLSTPSFLERSDDELAAWAAGVIERACPELAGHREMGHVTRWPEAGYLASPGFWHRSRALLTAIPPDGPVQLAGDLFGAGSIESAVRWGERAADRLLARGPTGRAAPSAGMPSAGSG